MPTDKVYNSPLDWYGGFMRAMGFGLAAIFERAKHYAMKDYYDSFDVKTYANTFEKVIAYSFVFSLIVLFGSGIALFITDVFDIYEWPEN